MEKNAKIYVAGHRGLVGSAIWKNLEKKGDLNKPLWEALQTKGIETASISTWNYTIK